MLDDRPTNSQDPDQFNPDAYLDWDRDETILIVEDDANVRETIGGVLAMQGWNVLTAVDGEEALRVAEEYARPIAAVVSDARMPRMNGIELFRQLRGWYPGIRFVLVSGYPETHYVHEVGAMPHSAFLPKPFTAEALVSTLERLLAEHAD